MSSRRIVIAVIALGIFVLVDLALFGWLIFRTLSQREIDRIVLETRTQAEVVADQIARDVDRLDQDLFMAIATSSDAMAYIDSILDQREEVEMVRVLDAEGRVVWVGTRRGRGVGLEPSTVATPEELAPTESIPLGEENALGRRGQGSDLEVISELPRLGREFDDESPYEVVSVPVGDVGSVIIGLRREEIEERLEELRGDLVRQAGSIGGLTVLVFAGAALLMWVLFRRSRRLEETAREAERMAYVGTLASGLAHEIRSPLNSLNLNMQLLEEDLGAAAPGVSRGDGSSTRLLEITRSEITRLERLVSDFLRYARPRRLELQKVRCEELLELTRSVLHGHARVSGTSIEVLDATAGASVRVDREQIQQLLLNLCENALHATSETSRPRIELLAERRGEGRVALGVRDNGSGMTEEDIRHATELFYSQRRGGTGLGLAIVERIASAHEGSLNFESKPGEGTTVWLELDALL